jgi:hypothetical protein
MRCKQCGECCKWIMIHMGSILYDEKWVEGRGGQRRGAYAVLPCRCKWLTPDNRCEIHGEQKPIWCKFSPEPGPYLKSLDCKFFEGEQ